MNPSESLTTGVQDLDQHLQGLYIGDNVIWYDDAGSLAWVFCQNFIKASLARNLPLIYVTYDRSPKNLLAKLGDFASSPNLVILDGFTWGKGSGSEVFTNFYDEASPSCRVVPLSSPRAPDEFSKNLYELHAQFGGEVHFVFESLTGMQAVWEGEEAILDFYLHACPRLYELRTVAYWIMEKEAHSSMVRAQINQTAQVVIELGIRRGTTSLTILKAENRQPESLHKPLVYWSQGLEVRFDPQKRGAGVLELGSKIKKMRLQRGVSQADLARLVGVTASNISQVESNQIYPSLPALTKIAEVLEVEVSHFFQDQGPKTRQLVFPLSQGTILKPAESSSDGLQIRLLLPEEASAKTRPHLIEFPPGHQLSSHFFQYKGEEIGYLLQGNLEVTIDNELKFLNPGDTIYLTSEMPCAWRNPTDEPAKLLWFTLASI